MAAKVEKQTAGFKFGKYRLEVLQTYGEINCNGKVYRFIKVRTNNNELYYSIRLYNAKGRFIKQFLFELNLRVALIELLGKAG